MCIRDRVHVPQAVVRPGHAKQGLAQIQMFDDARAHRELMNLLDKGDIRVLEQTDGEMCIRDRDPTADAETLDFLGVLGTESEEGAPAVLSSMVRRAVALNPNTSEAMLAKLANDPSAEVRHAVESRR